MIMISLAHSSLTVYLDLSVKQTHCRVERQLHLRTNPYKRQVKLESYGNDSFFRNLLRADY